MTRDRMVRRMRQALACELSDPMQRAAGRQRYHLHDISGQTGKE